MNPLVANILITSLSVILASILAFMVWIVKKLMTHDTALALLIQQVTPTNDKSLRTLVQEIQLEQARNSTSNLPHLPDTR